jgi:hypothetical protein
MLMKKGGVSFDVSHPSDIARLKHAGFVEVALVVEVKPEEQAIALELTQQEKDQQTVEEALQPAKKGGKK